MNKIHIIVGIVFIAILSLAGVASANPTFFPVTVKTSNATSTVNYMTPGTATTTLSYDSYASGNPRAATDATLLLQYVASSSSAQINIAYQFSQDGIDWYSNIAEATTTTTALVEAFSYRWNATAANATTSRALPLPTPVRYSRAVISVPAGAANGGVWGEIVPRKEVSE